MEVHPDARAREVGESRNGCKPSGRPVSEAACQIGSYTEWLNGFQSAVGFGRMKAATIPGSSAARRSSAALSSMSCCGNSAAPNNFPSPSLTWSDSQSLYARHCAFA